MGRIDCTSNNVCLDLQNWCYSIFTWCYEIFHHIHLDPLLLAVIIRSVVGFHSYQQYNQWTSALNLWTWISFGLLAVKDFKIIWLFNILPTSAIIKVIPETCHAHLIGNLRGFLCDNVSQWFLLPNKLTTMLTSMKFC